LQHLLRKTQRHMLRLMLNSGRWRLKRQHVQQEACSSSDSFSSSCSDSADGHSALPDTDDSEQLMEPWADWIQRVTHEAEKRMEKANLKILDRTAAQEATYMGRSCCQDVRWPMGPPNFGLAAKWNQGPPAGNASETLV